MNTDVGVYMRLHAMIKAATEAVPPDQAALSAGALQEAFLWHREAVRRKIPGTHQAEFEELFGDIQLGPAPGPHNPLAAANASNRARTLLANLAGWVDGLVQEEKFKAEASSLAQQGQTGYDRPFHSED
ncbi:hypothetical protein [Streptomyces mangrovi]|uniref:hypothetical protein n=1 Tax=Streptomyces mangrovi TaxID=1206892 RepID=UPI00399C9932